MELEEARAGLDRLLGVFGEETGLPGLATEENGVCILVFDGYLNVNLMADPRSSDLIAWSTVGELPGEGAEDVLRTLMRANLLWRDTDGGVVGLMDDSDSVVFSLRRPLEGMDVPYLRALIETVVLRAEQFRAALNGASVVAGEMAEVEMASPPGAIRG